jgi:hypothetical protein
LVEIEPTTGVARSDPFSTCHFLTEVAITSIAEGLVTFYQRNAKWDIPACTEATIAFNWRVAMALVGAMRRLARPFQAVMICVFLRCTTSWTSEGRRHMTNMTIANLLSNSKFLLKMLLENGAVQNSVTYFKVS